MARPLATFELDQKRLNARMAAFLRDAVPQVRSAVVRKVAFDVVAETVRGLNGVPSHPKRIDTGRYRAGWRMGAAAVGLPLTATVAPDSADPDNPSQPGDGYGGEKTGRHVHTITVGNNVEYALHVESGTVHMAPGHHLRRALMLAAHDFPKTLTERVVDAWRGR